MGVREYGHGSHLSLRERSRAIERVRAHGYELVIDFTAAHYPHREVPSHLSRRERFYHSHSLSVFHPCFIRGQQKIKLELKYE